MVVVEHSSKPTSALNRFLLGRFVKFRKDDGIADALMGLFPVVEGLLNRATDWYPLYTHVRRHGHSLEDAKDLTQAFFAHLLAKDGVMAADPARGRPRTFLLTALDHFLVNEWHRMHTQKRGGGQPILSLDEVAAEHRYLLEPATNETPESLFRKRWASALLEKVLADLEEECRAVGKGEFFTLAKGFLWGEQVAETCADLAARCRLTEAATKSALHRLRRRYRQLLRAEVARTVSAPEEIDGELQDLMSALSP